MRVISGEKKGHRLFAPNGSHTRPTEDRLKESLFNIISPIEDKSMVLDLFAGTGSIGIEFLSRGSELVYFVDNNRQSIEFINKNLFHTKLDGNAKIIDLDVKKALLLLKKDNLCFNYIYMDPPFSDLRLFYKTIDLIDSLNILSKNGLLIIEHDENVRLDSDYLRLIKTDERRYGKKILTFYNYKEVFIWE